MQPNHSDSEINFTEYEEAFDLYENKEELFTVGSSAFVGVAFLTYAQDAKRKKQYQLYLLKIPEQTKKSILKKLKGNAKIEFLRALDVLSPVLNENVDHPTWAERLLNVSAFIFRRI